MSELFTRKLVRAELPLMWTIDRRELIERIYRLRDGELVLEPHFFDVPGWAPGHQETEAPRHLAAFDRGGVAWGVFDSGRLVAAALTDTRLVGVDADLVQLEWLHVGRDHRSRGLGADLFRRAGEFAQGLGARGLYVSATPSEHTVNFYRGLGCTLTTPDPELFELEPEDIHLAWRG